MTDQCRIVFKASDDDVDAWQLEKELAPHHHWYAWDNKADKREAQLGLAAKRPIPGFLPRHPFQKI
jgi:hypothetical protein